MVDFMSIDKFLSELNAKCAEFISFKTQLLSKKDQDISQTEKESAQIIEKMQHQYDLYVEEEFRSIKDTIEKNLSVLRDLFPSEYIKAHSSYERLGVNFDEATQALKNKVKEINVLFSQLNEINVNALVPKQEIKDEGVTAEVQRGDKSKTLTSTSKKVTSDHSLIKEAIDIELVRQLFDLSKTIQSIVDHLESLFQDQFDMDAFCREVQSKKNTYINEIVEKAETVLNNELFERFQSEESGKPYNDFFETIERVNKQSIPDPSMGSSTYNENITLGFIKYQAIKNPDYMEYVMQSKPLAETVDKDGFIDIPLIASLRNKGNIVISTDQNRYSESLKAFINQIILSFLLSFPARRIHFQFVDIYDKMGFAPYSALKKIDDNILLDGIIRDDKQLEEAIERIKRIKFAAEDKLGAEGMINLFDYNAKYETDPMDVHVFILIDFPGGMNANLAGKVRDIMLNGKNDGVFTVLVQNNSIELDYNFSKSAYGAILDEIFEKSYVFLEKADEIKYLGEDGRKYLITPIDDLNISCLANVVETLKTNADTAKSKAIPLTDMFNYIEKTPVKDISSELDIPFGQNGSSIQTLRLTNQNGPHAAVIGTSGSGKSVFFHTLILDACFKYSPKELNLYLLDFKGGVEFKYYQNNPLPHIKVIGITNDLNDGLAILSSIEREIEIRNKLFNEIGVSNIESYYKAGKSIPRLFVIIDEIQEILVRDEKIGENALDILSKIMAIGRAFGINILWGSQSVPHVSGIQSKIMQNITNRICLKVANSDYAMGLFGDIDALHAVENLNRPGIKGLGIIRDDRTGSSVNEFRVAYSDEGEVRAKYIQQINNKWSKTNATHNLYVVGNDLVPDVTKDALYSMPYNETSKTEKAFESYWMSVGTDYVSGEHFPFEVNNSKERENMLIVGTNTDLIRDMMGYALLSISLNQLTDNNWLARKEKCIYYANKEGINPKFTSDLYNILPKLLEEQIETVGTADAFFNCIKDLYCTYLERKEDLDNGVIPNDYTAVYLFVHSIQYLSDLFEENRSLDDDSYSFEEDVNTNASISFNEAFNTLLKRGAQYGIHMVISINSLDSIREIRNSIKEFNYRIATIGANILSLTDMSSHIPSIQNDRTALFFKGEQYEKIRPYRYDEKDDHISTWVKTIISNYTK